MKMDAETFQRKYGKLKYLEEITARHPVPHFGKTDINRELMIKFKYGNLTKEEEEMFHNAIKKMIFKVMHKNNVMMDWDDVYQEIWKKICKSRHTWKEWKGTMVSTWITIVANSVINTLRQTVNRYKSRFVLYDDLVASSDEGGESSQQSKCDVVAFESDEEKLIDSNIRKMMLKEEYEMFREKLDDAEKIVFDIIMSMTDEILDAYDSRIKIPYKELRLQSGYDEATFAMIIYGIKKKYCETFNVRLTGCEESHEGDSDTEFLF